MIGDIRKIIQGIQTSMEEKLQDWILPRRRRKEIELDRDDREENVSYLTPNLDTNSKHCKENN